MRKIKYLIPIWILIISLLSQGSALAFNIQDLKNTAPVANFTVEKSRQVKLLVLTDYTGADNANLKNAITSMKSELANYAKIDVEYANPTDTTIGKQEGELNNNIWGKLGYASYTKTGYSFNAGPTGGGSWRDYDKTPVTSEFVYSNTITLPVGQTPTTPYGVPIKYTKSSLMTSTANTMGPRDYYTFSFINNAGICDGKFEVSTKYAYYFPNGAAQELDISISEPDFTYEDFWSILSTENVQINNTVTGWDLSKLNLQVQNSADTFVIFALNNEDTDYYTSHLASNYRLGQLRSDSNLGKYVKDSDARVYSICSENLENINLSTNPQYPVIFDGVAQNISLKDLMDSSFDGRSIGQKNITGLVNKIRENVRRPSDKIDMVVATDKELSSTNSFVNSIKDNISPDVDFQTNVVNMDSLEDVDTWTKYVVNGNYKNIDTGYVTDVNLILAENGDLWAQGSNQSMFPPMYNDDLYGLFGISETITYYPKFTKIATDVKDVVLSEYSDYRYLTILKNDGTIWTSNDEWKQDTWYPKSIKSIFKGTGLYNGGIIAITNDGQLLINGSIDRYAPPDVQYIYCYAPVRSDHTVIYTISYVTNDGSIYRRTVYQDQDKGTTNEPIEFFGKLPSPIKEIGKINGIIYCENNMLYDASGSNLYGIKYKQIYNLQSSNVVGIGEDGYVYLTQASGAWTQTMAYSGGFQKILFVEWTDPTTGYMPGIIGIDMNGKLAYDREVLYSNIFSTDNSKAGKKVIYTKFENFDASINDTAADYLQIGKHFAYVTKKGEICYVDNVYTGTDIYGEAKYTFQTVNCGHADTIFNTSPKSVKAFSKSKILNTPLRAGSERYFIYISDNIEKDTYFKDPSDYFLFDNLDSTILNYLNANRFNIYVVTPAQARELKLQYPYAPSTHQQYSLKELIYNSVMDSAFCKDEETVRKLIKKRYDTFTKQGSTTLTILVNEESVRYNQIYSDFEHDPKYSDKWQYTHDPTYFDNSNGLDSNSGKWITAPLDTFSKVGKYTVVAQFRDTPPKEDNRRDNYRLWSNVSAPATIIVHRRPVASFNTQIASKSGSTVNLTYLDKSYDLDHNISRSDKGIAARVWQYRKSTSDTWIDGKPSSLTYNTGVYQIQLLVKDIEGVWSKPYVDTIDTKNIPPSISATPTTYEGYGAVGITITASDNGENDFSYMRYAVTKSTDMPSSSSTDWISVPNGTKVKNIVIDKEGTYYLHMEAYDTAGQIGKNMTGPYTVILNRPPAVTITKSLSYVYEGDEFDIIMRLTDPDNDALNLVLEQKKDSGDWKTIYSKGACASGSTQTYHIADISAGSYQFKVTVTDPYGESGSASMSFTAYPLGIKGIVDHTSIWKTNWINYNKHLQSIGKPTYGNETFFAGEKYVLSAVTTKISPESSITASNVSVKIIERTYSPVWLTKQNPYTFTGEMWNEDMNGTRWRGKQATFLFTATYSNGTVKTDSVNTYIVNDDYYRVKMAF